MRPDKRMKQAPESTVEERTIRPTFEDHKSQLGGSADLVFGPDLFDSRVNGTAYFSKELETVGVKNLDGTLEVPASEMEKPVGDVFPDLDSWELATRVRQFTQDVEARIHRDSARD